MKSRNSALLIASRFVGLALSFFTVPYLLNWIGKAPYGAILYSFAIQPYVGLVDVGFTMGAQKYSIEALMVGDHERAHRIQRCQSLLCLVTGAAGWLVYLVIAVAARFEALPFIQSFAVFSLAGASFLAAIYGQVLTTTAVAYDRYYALTAATTAKDLIQNAILLWLAWTYRSVVALAWGYAIGTLVGLVALYLLLRLAKSPIYVRPLMDWPLIKEISAIGIRNVPNNVVGNLANRGDKVVLGAAEKNLAVFADYSFATRPIEIVYDLLRSAMLTITVDVTRALKTSAELASAAVYRNGLIMWTAGCCMLIPTSAVGDAFLRAWLHGTGVRGGGVIMVLMGFYYAGELHNLSLASLFTARGTPHKLIVFAAANAVLTLIFTIPMYRWLGLGGVALMNALIEAGQLPFRVRIAARELDAPFRTTEYVARCLAVLGVCTALFFAGRILADQPFVAHQKFAFLPVGFLLAAAALTVSFGLGISPAPQFVSRWLRPRSHRKKPSPEVA